MRRGRLQALALIIVGVSLWLLPVPGPVWGGGADNLPGDFTNLMSVLLGDGCPRLSPLSSSSNLANLCAATSGIPGESAAGATTGGSPASYLLETQLEKRMRARGTGANAGELSMSSMYGDAAEGLGGRLGVFVAYEFERYDKNPTSYESGYTADQHSGLLGIDYRFDTWLVGVAGHIARQSGTYDKRSGDLSVDANGGTVYASFFPVPSLFIDVTATYNRKDYEFNRNFELFTGPTLVVSGRHRGETSGDEYKFSVNSGYDFSFGKLTVGPRLGFNYSYNTMDGYAENEGKSITGAEVVYDDQQWDSATLNVGVYTSYAISTPWGVIVPQGSATYVHEFLRGQRVIYFHFAEDNPVNRFRFLTDRPDRDYAILSLGVLWQAPHGISPFLNYRTLVGYRDHSSHTVTAGLRVQF